METVMSTRPGNTEVVGGARTVEATSSAVSWAAIFAGAFVAAAISLVLVLLGSGLGLASMSPWHHTQVSAGTFTAMTAIWLIVVQWISSGMGAFLTGRLRTKWVGTHTHEVFFRDTAHGLITWAVATVFVTAVFASGMASMMDAGMMGAGVDSAAAASDAVADVARKSASEAAIYTSLSMLIGAFISCASAALGGRLRDEHP